MSAGRASRADGRKRLAGSGAADGVPEVGAAAPHRRHHGANDMDPQIIERAIKQCIDISVRLGALKDEVLPRPAASSSSSWTKSTKCSDGSKAASEDAGGWPGEPLRPPSRTRTLAAVTSTLVANRAGRNGAPRPPRPQLVGKIRTASACAGERADEAAWRRCAGLPSRFGASDWRDCMNEASYRAARCAWLDGAILEDVTCGAEIERAPELYELELNASEKEGLGFGRGEPPRTGT